MARPTAKLRANHATHLPMLLAAMSHADGPVVELGMGHFSTPILHYATGDKRLLVSCESDPAWADQFGYLAGERHLIVNVDDWASCELLSNAWAVALVDNQPAETRADNIARLARRTRLIIAHDTHVQGDLYGLEPVLSQFRYRRDYLRYEPGTTVVSNLDDLQWLDL